VPGVTTILSDGLPKAALINWAASATAEAAVNDWDRLTGLKPAARLKELNGARYADKDKAAKRGTEVHGFAEQLVKGEPSRRPRRSPGTSRPAPGSSTSSTSRPSTSSSPSPATATGTPAPATSSRRSCSRPARRCPRTGGRTGSRIRILGDWKTNRSGIFGETALQLAAYRYADVLLTGATEQPMPPVDACAAVHVRGDGYDLIPVTAGPEQHRTFLYAQQIAEWSKTDRDLIGAAVVPPTTSTFRLIRESA
jgi:hypothetical protein